MARFAVILLCLFCAFAAKAEPMDTDGAVLRMVFKSAREGSKPSLADRVQLAGAIAAFWKDFDSKVPRNSPAVAEWLNKELNTTDTARIGRATSTPEYALRELAVLADDCVSDAGLLTRSVGAGALAELYAWIRIVGCYGNPIAVEHHMKAASLSKGLYDGPLTMAHATVVHSFITGRVANAIVEGQ